MTASGFLRTVTAAVLVVASSTVLAQGPPSGGGSGANLTSQLDALAARVTAVEAVNATQAQQITALESTNGTQTFQLAALSARAAVLEGALTPESIAGEYAIIGFRMGAGIPPATNGFTGITAGGATQSGSASVVVVNGEARLIVNRICNVGRSATFLVANTNLSSGAVGKFTVSNPAYDPDDSTRSNPNPCENNPLGVAGAPLQISGSDLAAVTSEETLQFYTAAGGRMWVLNNLDESLVGTTGLPDYAAELVMLVKQAPLP